MKKLILAAALASALAPSMAGAQTLQIDMSKITCGEVLAMPADLQSDFAAYMSGFFAQKSGRTFIDVELFQKNVASVMDWCASNKDQAVFAGLERAYLKK